MKELFLGTKIITTKKFGGGENYTGTIVWQYEKIAGIKFDKPTDIIEKVPLHTLRGVLSDKSGYYLEGNEMDFVSGYDYDDINMKRFISTRMEIDYEDFLQSENKIKSFRQRIEGDIHNILSKLSQVKDYRQQILNYKDKIKEIEALEEPRPENYEFIYNKLLRNKKISEIKIEKYKGKPHYIIITEPLNYTNKRNGFAFPLGKYVFIISPDMSFYRVYNISNHYNKGKVHHPCVNQDGNICLGGVMGREIVLAQEERDLKRMINCFITFLEEPNYTSPYLNELEFSCHQPIKSQIEKYTDFGYEWFSKNETWDNDLYKKEFTEKSKEYEKLNNSFLRDASSGSGIRPSEDDNDDNRDEDESPF